jgi:hypothetical protein
MLGFAGFHSVVHPHQEKPDFLIGCKLPRDYQEFDLRGEGTRNEMVILVITLVYHVNYIHPSHIETFLLLHGKRKKNRFITYA